MDIQNSTTPNLRKIVLACSIGVMIAITSLGIYRYYREQCETLAEKIEYYQMETIVKEQFLSSQTYELISSLMVQEYWVDDIYQSINREPLIITSSSRHDDVLDITLVGTSQSFLSWYNMVQQKLKYCHIQIMSVDTKGNSIFFTCKVTPLVM